MTFLKNLFGGSEQEQQQTSTSQQTSGSQQTSASQQVSAPTEITPEAFQALQDPVAQAFLGLLGGGGFTGPTTAGITGTETDLVNQLGVLAGQPSPAQTAGTDLLMQTLSGQFLDPSSNPFLQSTIQAAQRPLIEQFQDITLPRLTSQFTAAGQQVQPQGSSAFDRAAAIASRGLFNSLSDIATNIGAQNFQAERGRQQEGIETGSRLVGQDIQNTIQALQGVALPRLIEQFGMDKGLEVFNQRIQTLLQAIQTAQGLPLFATGQVSAGGSAAQGTSFAQGTSEGQMTGSSETRPNIIGTLLNPFSFTRAIG